MATKKSNTPPAAPAEIGTPSQVGKAAGILPELGTTGLKRAGLRSSVDEEWLPRLRGDRGRKVLREMRDNDPTIGAIFFAIESLVRGVEWRLDGEDPQLKEFVFEAMHDMSHTWDDMVSEILSMLTFGFSWHEIIYKRRLGDGSDPTQRSRYNDGKIGWRKMPIRSQETINEWIFDEDGGVQAAVQQSEVDFKMVEIPITSSLLFRTSIHKGNPEGRSMLRNAYRPWWFKKRLEEIEAIGIERDLAGLPVVYMTKEMDDKYRDEIEKVLRNVRRDEQEGIILPLAYDENGNKMLEFQLVSSAGNRQIDVGASVDRYDARIAITALADFILLGQKSVGSFALADSKTGLFTQALKALLETIAATFNRHAIPRLLAMNGVKTDQAPVLVPGSLETPPLDELGQYIASLSGAGAPLFPDDELENHLRRQAYLPLKPENSGE